MAASDGRRRRSPIGRAQRASASSVRWRIVYSSAQPPSNASSRWNRKTGHGMRTVEGEGSLPATHGRTARRPDGQRDAVRLGHTGKTRARGPASRGRRRAGRRTTQGEERDPDETSAPTEPSDDGRATPPTPTERVPMRASSPNAVERTVAHSVVRRRRIPEEAELRLEPDARTGAVRFLRVHAGRVRAALARSGEGVPFAAKASTFSSPRPPRRSPGHEAGAPGAGLAGRLRRGGHPLGPVSSLRSPSARSGASSTVARVGYRFVGDVSTQSRARR